MTSPRVTEVRWSKRALRNLSEIHAFIADDKTAAADRQIALLFRSAEGLMAFPDKGRLGRIEGTRELVVLGTSHIAVYETLESTVFVLVM